MYTYCGNSPLMWADPLGLKTSPPLDESEWYRYLDDAAKAAAAAMQKRYDDNPTQYENGVEQFSWLIEYNNYLLNPNWEPGDPCLVYSFTPPVWGKEGEVTLETMVTEEVKLHSSYSIVGAVHSHGKNGGKKFSPEDKNFALTQSMRRERDFHFYVLGDTYDAETGTQEQQLRVRDVWRTWDPHLRSYVYSEGTYIINDYNPNKPPSPVDITP